MMSTQALFKSTERRVARMLGGQRSGHLGGADVVTEDFAVEVKQRCTLPVWLKGAVAQAKRHAGSRLPMVVLHEAGERHTRSLVILELGTFCDWFGSDVLAGADEDELRVLAPDQLDNMDE
jgi:hypothetical protein